MVFIAASCGLRGSKSFIDLDGVAISFSCQQGSFGREVYSDLHVAHGLHGGLPATSDHFEKDAGMFAAGEGILHEDGVCWGTSQGG